MENPTHDEVRNFVGKKFRIVKWSVLEKDYGSDRISELKKLGGIVTFKFSANGRMFYTEEVSNMSILYKEVEPVSLNEWQGGTRIRKVDYEQV